MRVLIIDDDSVDRMALMRVLLSIGVPDKDIIQVDSGSSAIDKITTLNEKIDVILLDYNIPPTTGLDILPKMLSYTYGDTAIVMLSHSNDEELALKCIESGAQDFLMKQEITSLRLKRAILMSRERHLLEKQIRSNHEQLQYLAERDSLTGLANRYYFDLSLVRSIQSCSRDNKLLALLLLDLNNFKSINDTLGHHAGDCLLKIVAERLKSVTRETDVLCRLGGDEFAIITGNLESSAKARFMTHRIQEALAEPVNILGRDIVISCSIGIATYPDCADNAVDILKCADVAMYRSKGDPNSIVHYYSRSVHEEVQYKVELERALGTALVNGEITLFYQPQVCGKTNRILGLEALARWNHSEFGSVSPEVFIPILEESNRIRDFGRWVMYQACHDYKVISDSFGSDISMSINLSAKQLVDGNITENLLDVLNNFDISPKNIELELTESTLNISDQAKETVRKLSGFGVSISLDDFGTGYSSLSHLKDFPIDIIKIDKSFVSNIDDFNDKGVVFLKAIAAFSNYLGYSVVAEGVETQLQAQICEKLGIARMQGYYYYKPMSMSALLKLLQAVH